MSNKKSIKDMWKNMNNILKSFIITLILAAAVVTVMAVSFINKDIAFGLMVFSSVWYFIYIFIDKL